MSTFFVKTDLLGKIKIESLRSESYLAEKLETAITKHWVIERIQRLLNVDELPGVLQEITRSISVEPELCQGCHLPLIVTQHLDEIGWNHFVSISDDFRHLKLAVQDSKLRNHPVDVFLAEEYPLVAPTISLSTPFVINLDWKPHFTLRIVLEKISVLLSKFGPYFDVSFDLRKER